jgi:prophage DNA circulation protein
MGTTIRDLNHLSFNGAVMPYQRVTIRGGLRYHVHEYPHVAGGSLEKLGRRLYEVKIATHFGSQSFREEYSRNWPFGINVFCDVFDKGTTGDLHIPWIGSIKACCVNYTRELNVKVISGEDVELDFVEDMDEAFRYANAVFQDSTSLEGTAGKWGKLVEETDPHPSLFDMINAAVNVVLAIKGNIEMWSRLAESKIRFLISLCEMADKTVKELNDPKNHALLAALHDLWLAARKLGDDIRQTGGKLKTWKTPRMMSVGEVTVAIYGNAQRASEILQLNALEDPYSVPANYDIRYFEAA